MDTRRQCEKINDLKNTHLIEQTSKEVRTCKAWYCLLLEVGAEIQ